MATIVLPDPEDPATADTWGATLNTAITAVNDDLETTKEDLDLVEAALPGKADLFSGKLITSQMNETYATAPAGSVFEVQVGGSSFVPSNTPRPSSRTDITFFWTTADGLVPEFMITNDKWINGAE